MELLQMSLSAGMMITVAAAIRVLAGRRFPKKVFVVGWWIILVRLLVPFRVPFMDEMGRIMGHFGAAGQFKIIPSETSLSFAASQPGGTGMDGPLRPPAMAAGLTAEYLWLFGVLLCAVYFGIVYIRCRRIFSCSLPVRNRFAEEWTQSRRLRRKVEIRQSGRIKAPLTYGIVRPVILMPEVTDWNDSGTLTYILQHEYIHIRQMDAAVKLLLAGALCIHWFNPLVWVMFMLANRDLELSCDESVLHSFDNDIKSAYALALIGMEEQKSGLAMFSSGFGRNGAEERIEAIMGYRKLSKRLVVSVTLVVAAVLCAAAVLSAYAVSPGDSAEKSSGLPEDSVSYDNVEVRHYKDGNAPYVYWARSNTTDKTIAEIRFTMLAFDQDGQPLFLPWTVHDSSAGYSYDGMCDWEPVDFKPDGKADSNAGFEEGGYSLGWSMDIFGKDTPELRKLFSRVSYVLCCDRQILFEDGSVWDNPGYEDWLETYKGKKTELSELQNFYPSVNKVTW